MQADQVQRASRQPQTVSKRRGHKRLFDREQCLSELRTLFSNDWKHPVGPIVIEGRTGVGKTALVGAACQIATAAGWVVLRARGDALKAQEPFAILRQLVDSRVGETSDQPLHDAQPAGVVARLDRLTRKLANELGLVIVIDDAQWSDEESSKWLHDLGPWPSHQRCRLLISMATRSPGLRLRPMEQIVFEPSSRVMSLGPLSPEAIGSLASSFFGARPDEALIRSCQEATGGNPFLLLALFRELSLEKLAPSAEAVARVETVTSAAVARSVVARLARLPPEATRLLEAVAVAAAPIDLDVIAEIAKMDAAKASAWADSLAAVDLLAREPPLRVLNPLVRRTVYAEIPQRRRAQLHIRTARSLRARGAPLDQLAEHLVAAEPRGYEWVSRTLEEAANLALTQGSPSNAVRYLNRALAEQPAARDRSNILLVLARAEASLDFHSALEHLRRALECGADPRAAAHAGLQVARGVNDFEARLKLGPMFEKIATLIPDEEVADKIDVAVATALLGASPGAAVTAAESLISVRDSRRHLTTRAQRDALALMAIVNSGSPRRARAVEVAEMLRHAMLGAELVSEDPLKCELWASAVLALALAGEFQEADRYARHAQTIARARSLEFADAQFSVTLAMSLAVQGGLVEAEDEARSALSVGQQRPWTRSGAALACLAGILLDQGRSEEADELISRSGEPEQQLPALEVPLLLEQRGRLRALQGRQTEALADFLSAGGRAEERGIDSPVVTSWRSEAALCLSAEGREQDAGHLAEENLELARAHGASWVVGSALHVVASVGAADKRLARLEHAVQLLDGSPAQVRLAGALIDLGRALREAGASPARARSALRRGTDIAFRSRAAPLLSKATRELHLSGARPRRLALSGTEALTSSERRIVSLAVKGLTNAEIADVLFLAEKTVEGHLGHAYRKLGVRSRRELKAQSDPESPEHLSLAVQEPRLVGLPD